MGELRFCPQCGENRYLKMKISIPILIVLLILVTLIQSIGNALTRRLP